MDMYVTRVTVLSDYDAVRERTKNRADAASNSKNDELGSSHQDSRLWVLVKPCAPRDFPNYSPAKRCATTL